MVTWLLEYFHWLVLGVFVIAFGAFVWLRVEFTNQDSGFRIRNYGRPKDPGENLVAQDRDRADGQSGTNPRPL